MSTPIRRTPRHVATVTAVAARTPRMRRITLHAPTLDRPRPAQDVELVVLDDTGRRWKRRYTIACYEQGSFAVDAVLHGHGPGARWAAAARPGDAVEFFGPRGNLELAAADWHLFVGDESALPAIAELAAVVDAPAYVIVEVEDAAEELPVDAEVQWLHRAGAAAGTPGLLAGALERFRPPAGAGHGYVLGESRSVVALRPLLADLGLTGDRLYLKGYWNAWDPRRHRP